MRADSLRRFLDTWWRDPNWPEPTLREVESIRDRLECQEITADDAAAELRRLENTVADPVHKGRLILAATQLVSSNVVEMKRR